MRVYRSLEQWETEFPMIKWREPLIVNEQNLACRVCVANKGMQGHEVPELPTDPADFAQHMLEAHGVDA